MNITALVVEDNEPTRRAIARLLESVGVVVHQAETVAAAMAQLNQLPALVVLDLMMPDGNGVEVLRTIRSVQMQSKVAVVSAVEDPAIFEEVMALHPDAVFGKPLEFQDFVDWLSETFTQSPVADGAASD